MVHAKLAISDMRAALTVTDQRLRAEQAELDTVRRRQGYAADIGDNETVAIAERFASQHAERVAVLESKRMVQQQELALAEREYESMSAELRQVLSGVATDSHGYEAAAAREVNDAIGDVPGTDGIGIDTPPQAARRSRAEREADADARLADLKRKLGL